MAENRGRPFDTDLDRAIITTAKRLLAAKGFEGLTVTEIVGTAGTTRSAFYRRYKDFIDLVIDIYLHEFPTALHDHVNTGSLPTDLRAIQEDQLTFFTIPMVNRGLSGFLGQLRSDDQARQKFLEIFLQPRRDATKTLIDRAIERKEIEGPYDSELICDILTGPFIFRLMIPEIGPLDDNLVAGTVTAALGTLGYTEQPQD